MEAQSEFTRMHQNGMKMCLFTHIFVHYNMCVGTLRVTDCLQSSVYTWGLWTLPATASRSASLSGPIRKVVSTPSMGYKSGTQTCTFNMIIVILSHQTADIRGKSFFLMHACMLVSFAITLGSKEVEMPPSILRPASSVPLSLSLSP